jgi:hypothetical protein
LPSVRKKHSAKNLLPIKYLPSVTLVKAFAECKIVFAECLRHSAKNAIPVVNRPGACFPFFILFPFISSLSKFNLNSNLNSNLVPILSSNYIVTLKVLILEIYKFSLYFIYFLFFQILKLGIKSLILTLIYFY